MNQNSEIEETRRINLLKKSKLVVQNKLIMRSFHKETTFQSIREESCEDDDLAFAFQDNRTIAAERGKEDTGTHDDSFQDEGYSLSWLSKPDSENSLDGSMN